MTSIIIEWTTSFPNSLLNSSCLILRALLSISVKITQEPSLRNFLAVAEPIPPAAPVIRATFPANSFSAGILLNFASSSSQYSILNASFSVRPVYLLIPSAPFITFIALQKNSLEIRAVDLFFAKDIIPYSGIKTITGNGSLRLGEPLVLFLL